MILRGLPRRDFIINGLTKFIRKPIIFFIGWPRQSPLYPLSQSLASLINRRNSTNLNFPHPAIKDLLSEIEIREFRVFYEIVSIDHNSWDDWLIRFVRST